MRHLKLLISLILFVSMVVLAREIIIKSQENQINKSDYAELNNFTYGLFSVDAWKGHLTEIVAGEIKNFSFTKENGEALQKQVEVQLGVLIDRIFERIKNTNSKSTQGFFKQSIMESLIDVKDIKLGIPEYAKAIITEMSKPKSEAQLKGMVQDKIDDFLERTHDAIPKNEKDKILARLKLQDEAVAKLTIQKSIARTHSSISELSLILIVLAVLLFIMEGFSKGKLPQSQYIILTLTLLLLMITGVTTPMIDMEAKISNLSFVLLDHPIIFENQVLYFQSKSILNVFWLMITHKEIQMKLVGVLLVAFSVVFPLLKILSSLAYYYDYCRARRFRIIQFFVLHSGKWSMADVFVVAMFMSYIGFNGVINSQLGLIAASAKDVKVLTTNGTNLQPGYYLFLAYTLLAMFLAGFLKSRPCYRDETQPAPKDL